MSLLLSCRCFILLFWHDSASSLMFSYLGGTWLATRWGEAEAARQLVARGRAVPWRVMLGGGCQRELSLDIFLLSGFFASGWSEQISTARCRWVQRETQGKLCGCRTWSIAWLMKSLEIVVVTLEKSTDAPPSRYWYHIFTHSPELYPSQWCREKGLSRSLIAPSQVVFHKGRCALGGWLAPCGILAIRKRGYGYKWTSLIGN